MTVAPGTAASAAARTFAAVVPVSRVSPGPCATVRGSGAPFGATVAVPVPAGDPAPVLDEAPDEVPVAAAATPAAVRTVAAAAPVTIQALVRLRRRLIRSAPPVGAHPGGPGTSDPRHPP